MKQQKKRQNIVLKQVTKKKTEIKPKFESTSATSQTARPKQIWGKIQQYKKHLKGYFEDHT